MATYNLIEMPLTAKDEISHFPNDNVSFESLFALMLNVV